jgi:hypothetical protein
VLERPLAAIGETGLGATLSDSALDELKGAVGIAVAGIIDPDDFLARTHLLVMSSPEETAIGMLAERLGLPPASCVAHHAILRRRLAHLADENGIRPPGDPAALTIGDIARLLDEVSEAIDSSLLEQAVRDGVAELADFVTPVDESRFFSGVPVVVGHVVAGLPLDRPEVAQLNDAITTQRIALAVGPSGAGKSALIWLTAYASRHEIRWYRVRQLYADDVPALVRVVKSLRPTGVIVGFVIDDIGRDDRSGFDHLAKELREQPSARILGACREEDLFLVRCSRDAIQVRPRLETELAERLWRELRARSETPWPEWREPFERSEGLLLEYNHLLAEGKRLPDTIAEQIEQRVREHRSLELEIMALVATADAFGSAIDVSRLSVALGADATQMKEALARLIAEHLIDENDGLLSGLHELRSRYAMEELHRIPPPKLAESVSQVIMLVAGTALQTLVTRLLLAGAVPDNVAVDALAARLGADAGVQAIAAALQALRVVGFQREAALWREIFAAEGVHPAHIGVITFLLAGSVDVDADVFPEPVRRAVTRIRQLDQAERTDLRRSLLEEIDLQTVLAHAEDISAAMTVLAALGEFGMRVNLDVPRLASLVNEGGLADVRLLLEVSYAIDRQLAVAVADELGGSRVLLQRLEREQPWVRGAELVIDDDGLSTAKAHYAYVAGSAQPEALAAITELWHYLAALAPQADIIATSAIDATGGTAGWAQVPLADWKIERRTAVSPAIIARNRARTRAAMAAVACPAETDYLLRARDVIMQSALLACEIGDLWVHGQPLTPQLAEQAAALAELMHSVCPPPVAIEISGPLERGEVSIDDPVAFVGTMIANNVVPRLFQGEDIAAVLLNIVIHVDTVAAFDRWYLLESPPVAELQTLRQTLLDMRAVVAERARGGRDAAASLVVAGQHGLGRAAQVARSRAGARMQAAADQVEQTLAEAGFSAQILRRPGSPDSGQWPNEDFLVLVNVQTIPDWIDSHEMLADLCRPLLVDRNGFLMAPIRDGRVVASFARKISTGTVPDDSIRSWPDLPLLDERLTDAIRRGMESILEASGIAASIRRAELHEGEAAALAAGQTRAHEALGFVATLVAENDDHLLAEIHSVLTEMIRCLEHEIAAMRSGRAGGHSLAASYLAGLRGESSDTFAAQMVTVIACAEWDVSPAGAWGRVEHLVHAVFPED